MGGWISKEDTSNNTENKKETWSCPKCTYVNDRKRPGCGMCASERPLEAMTEEDKKAYLDAQPLLLPEKAFECLSCYTNVKPEEGVRLRNCGCEICKQCANCCIAACDKASVPCPLCQKDIYDRDVKNLISNDAWDERLKRALKSAETRIPKAFHCLTPDCPGWVEMETSVDETGRELPYFLCLTCSTVNCVACKAQHEGKTCEQHRKEMKEKKEKDIQLTVDYLEDLLKKGEAMRCPECRYIVQRNRGCGYIVCPNSACRLPLCWYTKGRRWGPKGRGDNSGGCRCRVDGKRCAPTCRNCH